MNAIPMIAACMQYQNPREVSLRFSSIVLAAVDGIYVNTGGFCFPIPILELKVDGAE
jgi:hypothetical protein